MQELITEIAIYLGVAGFLGLVLGYLIWGMGSRRRIEAARAEGAADVRTSVDGDASLRSQIEKVTRERDRLEHRVEVLSARVAALQESGAEAPAARRTEEELGVAHLQVADVPADRMEAAAASFPETAADPRPDDSIFEPGDEVRIGPQDGAAPRAAPGAGPTPDDVSSGEDRPDSGVDGPKDTDDPTVADDPGTSDSDRQRTDPQDRNGDTPQTTLDAAEEALPLRNYPRESAAPEPDAPDAPASDAPKPGGQALAEAADSLRDGLHRPAEDETGPAAETATDAAADAETRTPPPSSDAAPTGDEASMATSDHPPPPESGSAFLLAEAPGTPDDLTRIKGIGKSTARALNARGIWLFSQLADMTDADMDWLRAELGAQMGTSVKKWADQARALADE